MGRPECSANALGCGSIRSNGGELRDVKSRCEKSSTGSYEIREREEEDRKDGDDGMSADAAPGSDEDLPAVCVATHDWEHYSSIPSLTGPHQGVPNVVEKPPPDEMVLNEPPSPVPSEQKPRNIVVPAFYHDPQINWPKSSSDEDRLGRRAHTKLCSNDDSMQSSSAPSSSRLQDAKSANANARSRATRRSPKRLFYESEEVAGELELGQRNRRSENYTGQRSSARERERSQRHL